jgi:hypothetical protein
MFKEFLAKLGANTKITVGVSISPGIGLEMAEVDMATRTVSKYACKPLDYNFSSREVSDYEQFRETLESLFSELQIPKNSNIILTVPTVLFGTIDLPLLLQDEAVTNAIISEVEQSYIFKRQDPVVSWAELVSNSDTENRQLAYGAIQQSAIDGFEAACSEIGCHISAIEISCLSLMKALSFMELTEKQMKENVSWNLMVVNQNSYDIFSMVGKRIVEYYEEPLALKSFVDDEIYNAIITSAQLTLSSLPANYLYIVSETDLVSAEILSMKFQFGGQINFLESNKYSQNEIMPVNLDIIQATALKITPEIIGSAVYITYQYPIKFNFIQDAEEDLESEFAEEKYPTIMVGNTEVEITPTMMKKLVVIISVFILFPLIFLLFMINPIIDKKQSSLDDINSKIKTDQAEIKKYNVQQKEFDPQDEAKKITQNNRTEILSFGALGSSIPNKLWVTYYDSDSQGHVDVKGKSSDVDSVYIFYKNMKQLVDKSDLRIHKLELESTSVDAIVSNAIGGGSGYFVFEITNMPAGTSKGASAAPNSPANGQQPGPNGSVQPNNSPQGASANVGNIAPSPASNNSDHSSAGNNAPKQPASVGRSPSPSGPSPSTGGGNSGLPPNLQKIEKF